MICKAEKEHFGGMIMELRSQAVRKLAPENDPLKIGMGWKVDDLAKPQIMVESTFGDSHPGSAHLDQFVKEAVQAVNTHGGKAARYFCDRYVRRYRTGPRRHQLLAAPP